MMHSKNLVDWEVCSNIVEDITQIGPELNWDCMDRYARGIWAGTLRYHNGRFHLFFGTPDEGFFTTSSQSAEGPWLFRQDRTISCRGAIIAVTERAYFALTMTQIAALSI